MSSGYDNHDMVSQNSLLKVIEYNKIFIYTFFDQETAKLAQNSEFES